MCDAPHKKSLTKGNKASVYVVGLRLTMLKIHMYHLGHDTIAIDIVSSAKFVYHVCVDNGKIFNV